jgi:glycosyltransferase involved in cell wall biosynthesis
MRIRYVLFNAYAMGGTARSVINQANALCGDHDIEIASVYRHREQPRFAIDPRIRLVSLTDLRKGGSRWTDPPGAPTRRLNKTRRFRNPFPHGLDGRFRRWDPVVDISILRYIWAENDGVLVTTRPALNLFSAWFGPRRLIRVGQDHMNLASYRPALREAIVRGYRRLDAVTVLTDHDHAAYRDAFADSALRVERIPNGVPPPRHGPAALEAKVLVAAGRLEHQKGFDLLLDAFALVAPRHPDWTLWIFGEGRKRADLAARIERLGLTGRARLKGNVTDLDTRFAAASVYVLSSRFEGLPMVLLEAMSAGLPVVSFDCPTGPAEVVRHGRTGLLVPAGDVAGLAAGIDQLIGDPRRRRAMGAAAARDADRFSISTVRQRWDELFTDLAHARADRRPPAVTGHSRPQ